MVTKAMTMTSSHFLPLSFVRAHHKRAYFNPLVLGLLVDVFEQRDAVGDNKAGAAHL